MHTNWHKSLPPGAKAHHGPDHVTGTTHYCTNTTLVVATAYHDQVKCTIHSCSVEYSSGTLEMHSRLGDPISVVRSSYVTVQSISNGNFSDENCSLPTPLQQEGAT